MLRPLLQSIDNLFPSVNSEQDPTCDVAGGWWEPAPPRFVSANGCSISIKFNTERSHTSLFFFSLEKVVALNWKGSSRRWRLSLLNGFPGWWLAVALSRLSCPLVFARVISVPSAKLFHSSSLYGLETFLMLLNSEYSCVSTCCFSMGDGFLPSIPSMGGNCAGLPSDACAKKEKAGYLPSEYPPGDTPSEWLRQWGVPVEPFCPDLGVAVVKWQDRGQKRLVLVFQAEPGISRNTLVIRVS